MCPRRFARNLALIDASMKNEPAILFKESAASEAFVEAEADLAASAISHSGFGDHPQMTSAKLLDYLTRLFAFGTLIYYNFPFPATTTFQM